MVSTFDFCSKTGLSDHKKTNFFFIPSLPQTGYQSTSDASVFLTVRACRASPFDLRWQLSPGHQSASGAFFRRTHGWCRFLISETTRNGSQTVCCCCCCCCVPKERQASTGYEISSMALLLLSQFNSHLLRFLACVFLNNSHFPHLKPCPPRCYCDSFSQNLVRFACRSGRCLCVCGCCVFN